MNSKAPVFLIHRHPFSDGNEIPLELWLSYVASSAILQLKPREERQGINPFTKQSCIYRSARGGAFFEGPKGRCEVCHDGIGLSVRGAVGHAESIVKQIAKDLGAKVQLYDPETETVSDL